MFDTRELFIQRNTDGRCEHIIASVNIYFYVCVRLLVCVLYVCLCVWYQIKVLVEPMSSVGDL